MTSPSLAAALHVILQAINHVYRVVLFLPPQASTMATRIDALHYAQITFYAAVALVYYVVAIVFLLRYRRRSAGQVGVSVRAPMLTAGYAVGMFVIFAAFWLVGALQFRQLHAAPDDAIDVYVSAKQWMWKFAYPNGSASLGVLYVPAGQPVRLLLTSRDVIHSFFVPAFRVKQDAVPGTYTSIWFQATTPGEYPIFCSQMCGVGHARMRGQVSVLDPAAYEAWARSGLPTDDVAGSAGGAMPIVELGRQTAANFGCLKCHSIDGQPHIGPTWLGLYGSRQPLADGTAVVANEAYLTESMMDPAAKVVRGFSPVMPSFQGLLTPADTAALLEFIKSLRDPNQPHVVSPPPAAPIPGIQVPAGPPR